nr:hypothetical protein [Tanacetum cinerariifolium]
MDECQTEVNKEVVREDSGEIKISGDVVVSGMDHVSDEYVNTNLENKHREDSGKKIGVGRIGFERVLVEIQAKKRLPDKIEGMNQDVKADDFDEVVYKRNVKQQVNKNFKPSQKGNVSGGMNVKTVYKQVNDKNGKWEKNDNDNKSEPDSRMEKIVKPADPNENKSIGINKVNATKIQKTNKFSILSDYEEDDLVELNGMANREKVDSFLRMKSQPAVEEMRY